MAWKATMVARAKELPGVTERGRIGQDELNKEIFKSGIFAYPCIFPEVNCITAQKAMAGGAIPVTSDFAVLDDIIEFGEKVHLGEDIEAFKEEYKEKLIWWLQHPEEQEKVRGPMMAWARSKFDWKVTAAGWNKEML
jgi:glycosyltransferase involved in cell wall biosynthesis